jgi:hypothetical protein
MAKNNGNTGGMAPEEVKKELLLLKNSYDMYEKTKEETENVMKTRLDKNGNKRYTEDRLNDTMKLMQTMQDDIVKKYAQFGGNPEELKAKKRGRKSNGNRKKMLEEIMKKERMREQIEAMKNSQGKKVEGPEEERNIPEDDFPTLDGSESRYIDYIGNGIKDAVESVSEPSEEVLEDGVDNYTTININPAKAQGNNIKFDYIPLPSKGEGYKSKIKKIPVAYLTAYDENLIVSPNLYKDGTFLEYMLKTKIMTDEIEADELLPGDRDAIILWLRGSGYGPEYPVTATDNATGEKFETVVDLSKISVKKFTLKGDANGHFTFELPFSKDKIKFKFLSYKDIKNLEKMEENENLKLKKLKINELNSQLGEYISADEDIDRALKMRMSDAMKAITEYANSIDAEEDTLFSHTVTNKLIESIVSVNGVTDRKYINEYVMFMNVRDSSALRKYITENEPGMDFNVTVQKPASLGGGSLTMFLTLDQFIFLNIA